MAQIKVRDFEKAMIKKGFQEKKEIRKNNSHIYYYFIDMNGKVQFNVRTFRSNHSNQKYISDDIISKMARQLNFPDKKTFDSFLECSISRDDYNSMLVEKCII